MFLSTNESFKELGPSAETVVCRTFAWLSREAPGIFVALLYSSRTGSSLHQLYNNSTQFHVYSSSFYVRVSLNSRFTL